MQYGSNLGALLSADYSRPGIAQHLPPWGRGASSLLSETCWKLRSDWQSLFLKPKFLSPPCCERRCLAFTVLASHFSLLYVFGSHAFLVPFLTSSSLFCTNTVFILALLFRLCAFWYFSFPVFHIPRMGHWPLSDPTWWMSRQMHKAFDVWLRVSCI